MRLRRCGLPVGMLLLSVAAWCQGSEPVRLVGVGSTFPLHLYSRWLPEFEKARGDIHATYLPFGSLRGIEAVVAGTADFGASDVVPPSRWGGKRMRFFPIAVGAIVPIYNLPGVRGTLRFTPQALAGIYLGTITRWDDPAIAGPNPKLSLPARAIVVIHSAEGRGSTYIWSDYLTKVSPEWKTRVGRGASLNWPVGTGVDGNGNVAKAVRDVPNSIGYVESGYAAELGLPQGIVENAAGRFVSASPANIAAAGLGCVKSVTGDFRCSITNAAGEGAYPIASFTWFVVPESGSSPEKQEAVKDLLRWILKEGQSQATKTSLVKVPDRVVEEELRAIERMP